MLRRVGQRGWQYFRTAYAAVAADVDAAGIGEQRRCQDRDDVAPAAQLSVSLQHAWCAPWLAGSTAFAATYPPQSQASLSSRSWQFVRFAATPERRSTGLHPVLTVNSVRTAHGSAGPARGDMDSQPDEPAQRTDPSWSGPQSRKDSQSSSHSASTTQPGHETLSGAGWTRREVLNAPNAISAARILSGPLIAYWILAGQWGPALTALIISGLSDWLDGYVARRFNQQSKLGSYLDPIADKVLLGCVVGALGFQGILPLPLVALILGRDVLLVAGSFAVRARALGWRWPGAMEFFRLGGTGQAQGGHAGPEAASAVAPLYISKVNTAVQLVTVGSYLTHAAFAWPPAEALTVCTALTVATTVVSTMAYVREYARGSLSV